MEENQLENSQIKPSKKKEYIIITLLGIFLLGSLVYNFYQSIHKKQLAENLTQNLENSNSVKENLQIQLDSLKTEFEKTRGEMNVRDSLLSDRDAQIFDKQKEIQNILNKKDISESELKQAKRMISALNADIGRFKQELVVLQHKNDSLTVANDTLASNQEKLSGELADVKEKSEQTENNIRSTFSISNYEIKGLRFKSNGKEVESEKASKIDKLRVSFDLEPNQYAKTGTKEIYIAIYKPDGKLGKFKGAEPGQLDTWSLGTVNYSDKVNFNYTQATKQNISFDWEEYEFPKGIYKIDLYQNGFKIGSKNLELK